MARLADAAIVLDNDEWSLDQFCQRLMKLVDLRTSINKIWTC